MNREDRINKLDEELKEKFKVKRAIVNSAITIIYMGEHDMESTLHKHGFCLGRLLQDGVFYLEDIEEAYEKNLANKYTDIEKIYKKYIRNLKLKQII